MINPPIYKIVKEKLIKHGVKHTNDGLLTLTDRSLFLLFVDLERAKQAANYEQVTSVTDRIESYLNSINKRHLIIFAFMYLYLSDLTPKLTETPEHCPDGHVKKTSVFVRDVSDEERLIGLWANVKYNQLRDYCFQVLSASGKPNGRKGKAKKAYKE